MRDHEKLSALEKRAGGGEEICEIVARGGGEGLSSPPT